MSELPVIVSLAVMAGLGRVGAMANALKGEQVAQYFKGRDAGDFVLERW